MKSVANKDILRKISTPRTLDEIKRQLKTLEDNNGTFRMTEDKKKSKSFFKNITTFIFKR